MSLECNTAGEGSCRSYITQVAGSFLSFLPNVQTQTDRQTIRQIGRCMELKQAVHTIAAEGRYLFTLVQHAGM